MYYSHFCDGTQLLPPPLYLSLEKVVKLILTRVVGCNYKLKSTTDGYHLSLCLADVALTFRRALARSPTDSNKEIPGWCWEPHHAIYCGHQGSQGWLLVG